MTATTFFALLPDTTVKTRTSKTQTYTTAVIAFDPKDNTWFVWSWHTTTELGAKALSKIVNCGVANPYGYVNWTVVDVVTTEPVTEVVETVETETTEVAETAAAPAAAIVTAHVDLTSPKTGVVLVTGTAASDSPQAHLGHDGHQFYMEDTGWGITVYRSNRDAAVRAYLRELSTRYLGFNAKTAMIKTQREY